MIDIPLYQLFKYFLTIITIRARIYLSKIREIFIVLRFTFNITFSARTKIAFHSECRLI